MKKILNYGNVAAAIAEWLKDYSDKSNTKGFVIGVSGGIDSAVVSTLAAMTGKNVLVVTMPIKTTEAETERANQHIEWLKTKFNNVASVDVNLTATFESLANTLSEVSFVESQSKLTMANTKSRTRMITLYYFAGMHQYLVAGTGNKVEDFGVGFYTKYGDGGVDLSPIADLMKSEVVELAKDLGIVDSIIQAKPTDGLWEEGHTDEDQIGASYPELEWAMNELENPSNSELTERQAKVIEIFKGFNTKNHHKMDSIPVFNTESLRG